MSRTKSGPPIRARPIEVPAWWMAELHRLCGDRPKRELADALNTAVHREPPFSIYSVYDFLNGKVVTDVMRDAFLVLFPELPPPSFVASSLEEARTIRDSARSRTLTLPAWWLPALRRLCDGLTPAQIAERLNAIGHHSPISAEAVANFLSGRVTTQPLMMAFLVLYPDFPAPIFIANSYEEAHRIQQVSRTYARYAEEVPRVTETIEDTGELSTSKKPGRGHR